jgi:outer membrane protein assembly factor BamD
MTLRLPLATPFLCLILLTACADTKDKDALPERPAEELFAEANKALNDGEYKQAVKLYDELERQHPYSSLATKAQIRSAFTLYQNMKYDDAVDALDRFIQMHPGHADISYVYYLRALSYYEQIADVRRDQTNTQAARDALSEVVKRFPGTTYASDAQVKIDLVNDQLAGQDMEVGRFYLSQNLYTAALSRFRTVVTTYQTTSHVPEALERMIECYLALGLGEEARVTGAVLGHNFPGSPWYEDAYRLLTRAGQTPDPAAP